MSPKEKLAKYGFKGEPDKMAFDRNSEPVELDPPYPKPKHRFRFTLEQQGLDIEEIYYWIHTSIVDDFGFADTHKIKDIFTSSEMSSFFGASQQRLQIQQGQVSNYLATIGKLTKELFQLVRELRIMSERLDYYELAKKGMDKDWRKAKKSYAPEITLKGIWVDLKDGGAKSPGSVYGLASVLGYATLPDLFFHAPPLEKDQIDPYVESLQFNQRVKDVLKRKLYAYTAWKEQTYKELKHRKNFTLKYLRQHYNSIQMYINWVKPYLQNVTRLSPNSQLAANSTDLVSGFEGSLLEIEYIAAQPSNKKYRPVILVSMIYRTRPQLQYADQSFQHRGPQHTGKVTVILRDYAWTKEDIENYKRMRQEEFMEDLLSIDEGLREAIEGLGDDLYYFLEEAGDTAGGKGAEKGEQRLAEGLLRSGLAKTIEEAREKARELKKQEEEKKNAPAKQPGVLEPFAELIKGFGVFLPDIKKKPKKQAPKADDGSKGSAERGAEVALWQTYKNFKASHGMVKW
ncbi:hypothetical protein D6774_03175 [Candidatus Woesearchaeota archaeon]|nr:MAG: hypothetical protein D6774_03175 [Candidatus Woesearchaeota archaeon]